MKEERKMDYGVQEPRKKKPMGCLTWGLLSLLILAIPSAISTALAMSGVTIGGLLTIVLYAPFISWIFYLRKKRNEAIYEAKKEKESGEAAGEQP